MARILITGGAGFIGSLLSRKFLQRGDEVIVFDAFIHYTSPIASPYPEYLERRFQGIRDQVTILRGDTTNATDVRRVITKHRPDRIVHLAALPIADMCNTYSEEAINTILHGTANILEAIRDTDCVQRFVYTSSSMVYGDFQYTPADEEHPRNPKEVYGGTKFAGEIITQAFGRRFGIEYTIVRPSAVYGPTDLNRRVSQIFVENAFRNREIVLHDGGETKLDFTYVDDIAEGLLLATVKDEARNEVFNITRGEGRSLREFAELLREYFPNVRLTSRPGDFFRPRRGALDISKARSLLRYEPRYSLEEGLRKYVEFFQGYVDAKASTP